MKDRPILFSAPMVRALLDDSKTQTRRVVKPQPYEGGRSEHWSISELPQFCPYGQPGDRLWVREAWMPVEHDVQPHRYRATNPSYIGKWKPSIHMPRVASRITLEIVSVRVERLQDISEGDAVAEGIDAEKAKFTLSSIGMNDIAGPVAEYSVLWEAINGPGSWDANPWVWCVEFKRVMPS